MKAQREKEQAYQLFSKSRIEIVGCSKTYFATAHRCFYYIVTAVETPAEYSRTPVTVSPSICMAHGLS